MRRQADSWHWAAAVGTRRRKVREERVNRLQPNSPTAHRKTLKTLFSGALSLLAAFNRLRRVRSDTGSTDGTVLTYATNGLRLRSARSRVRRAGTLGTIACGAMHWFDGALHACAKALMPTALHCGVTSACECGLRWTVAELFESSLSHASVRAARAAWRRRTIDGVMSTEIDVDGS